MREEIKQRTRIPVDEFATFRRGNSIQELGLFGSALREDFGLGSDLDLLGQIPA